MKKLAQNNKEKVIDLLCERLAFERDSVKIYDKILERMRAAGDPMFGGMVGQMKEHRDEEKEHEEWLEECVQQLGGDDQRITDKARLVKQESKGIEQVVMSDPEIPHLIHALLAAELVDNAGWDLLVELADEAGDREAVTEFKKRLHEEENHLILVREAVAKLAAHEVLHRQEQMPDSP